MKIDSKLSRLVFVSPWPVLLFFIIPLLFILSVKLHVRLPLADSKYPLLYNNAVLSLFLALRFIYYLKGIAGAIRYGAKRGLPREATDIARPAPEVRNSLADAGFHFENSGAYAEKRDRGYLGTTMLYAGLFLVLFTGTLDNMRQFSGTLLHGVGAAVDLSSMDRYRAFVAGPFTGRPTTLPKMKILRYIVPDATYPLGAAEVAFAHPDGKQYQTILKYPEPYRVGSYDIYMAKMLYEPKIAVAIDGDIPVYNGQVMLWPLAQKVDDFGFYAPFVDGTLDGEVYYQPEKSRLKMVLRQGRNVLMNKELIFQVERQQTSGNISFTVERMGVWTEIKVVRRRHMSLIMFGGVLTVIGLLMRVAIRPQRVWLEATAEGCRVRAVGGEAERHLRLKVEG